MPDSTVANGGIVAKSGPRAGRGILTLAFGPRQFVEMAKNLARSLQLHCPNIPRAAVTDSHDPELKKLYDICVPWHSEWGNGFMQKVCLGRYSPFQETLYIDSDCLVVRDIDYLWDLFQGRPFGIVGLLQESGDCAFHPRVEALLARLNRPALPIFNGGLYSFRDDPASAAVFETARQIMLTYDNWGLKPLGTRLNDEAAFAVALAQHRIAPVPDDGSVMCYTYYFFGRLKLDVLQGRCRFLCRYLNKPVEPAIVHLLWLLCDSFIYYREVLKLRLALSGVPRGAVSGLVNLLFNPPYAVYALVRRAWKRWRHGVRPILPAPLWEVGGKLPPWQPPWQERRDELQARRARHRRWLVRLIGWRNFQRLEACQQQKPPI